MPTALRCWLTCAVPSSSQPTAASLAPQAVPVPAGDDPATESTIPLKTKKKKNLTGRGGRALPRMEGHRPGTLPRVVRKIIQFDLDPIENKADYVICYWKAPMQSGARLPNSMVAYRKGIPVYLVSEQPVEQVSGIGIQPTVSLPHA